MNIRRQLGLNLRRLRVARNISQQDIALEAAMSLSYLSNIELGKANPSITVIGKIAEAIGVEPADLLKPISAKEVPAENLKRGRNLHHQGRRGPKARRR